MQLCLEINCHFKSQVASFNSTKQRIKIFVEYRLKKVAVLAPPSLPQSSCAFSPTSHIINNQPVKSEEKYVSGAVSHTQPPQPHTHTPTFRHRLRILNSALTQ
jgi:hypothetical protein